MLATREMRTVSLKLANGREVLLAEDALIDVGRLEDGNGVS